MSTSAKNPISVKECANSFARIMKEIPPVWVEGEISQLNARPGSGVVYLTLRDLNDDYNIPLKMFTTYYKTLGEIKANAKVIVKLRADFWANGGRMTFHVDELHQVGVGDLFAKLEALKNKLFEEGLFDPANKKAIPFLPNVVGIICGRDSDAKKDVVENARRKWPAVQFEIREVAVQGANAVKEVSKAFDELNENPAVSVIVITRGGGSFEDLLPFSDETLLRRIAKKNKPVISAIGHEKDQPLLDYLADWRASTPTDAGKKIVPDYLAEDDLIKNYLRRLNNFAQGVVSNESQRISALQERALNNLSYKLELNQNQIAAALSKLRALSPKATLERGYAIVEDAAGKVVKSKKSVKAGAVIRVIFAADEISATVTPSKVEKE